jgi:ATP-dependent DNA ligase
MKPAVWPELDLPVKPPFAPMEAKLVRNLPAGEGWQLEPKWDGFRCLAFRDWKTVALQSKAGQPLGPYFPEVQAAVLGLEPERFVLDGEILIPEGEGFSFDALLLRIHPAESRVKKLSHEIPAIYRVFDLVVDEEGRSLVKVPLRERRRRLEEFAARFFGTDGSLGVSPASTDRAETDRWLQAKWGIDGIVAKRLDEPYRPGSRDAMQKVKTLKSADCVVAGFRYLTKKKAVSTLLLGLYAPDGLLHHVGHCSGIKTAERAELTRKLEALRKTGSGFTGHAPGGPSRWSTARSMEWEAIEPSLVCEVAFDHASGGRFRHGTTFLRWRPDKDPRQCTFDQLRGTLSPRW